MNFVEILKIQFGRIVLNFKLNPLIKKKKDLAQKWKIPIVEILVFKILGS
jgi:hypothetical protein